MEATIMEKKPPSEVKLSLLFIFIGIVIFLWVAYWVACVYFIPFSENSAAIRGQFGDMFGGINALFAAFAFAGLLYTVYLQREQLSLQRQELEEARQEAVEQRSLQRQELEDSRKESIKQITTMQQTVWASALDALIRVHTRILEKDSQDSEARKMPHYADSVTKLGLYKKALETLVEPIARQLVNGVPEPRADSQERAE
jgi:hypothetical protein